MPTIKDLALKLHQEIDGAVNPDNIEAAIQTKRADLADVEGKLAQAKAAYAKHPLHTVDQQVAELEARHANLKSQVERRQHDLNNLGTLIKNAKAELDGIAAERRGIAERLGVPVG
jgi:chromosome segregation ATPase